MSARKYTYAVEVQRDSGSWYPIIIAETRDYCLGYLASHGQFPGPRLAVRVVRSDGKEVDDAGAEERAALGMVAGFPSAEQYEQASARCLAQAAEVRKRKARAEGWRVS